MFDSPSTDEDHTVGGIVRLNIRRQVILFNGQDICFGAEDGSTKRLTFGKLVCGVLMGGRGMLTLECNRVEMVKDYFFQLLINLLLFSQYHIPLPLNRTALQLRVL